MVRNDILHLVEPEKGEPGKHLAFVFYARRKHNIEGGKPVRGDDQQLSVQLINISDLSFTRGSKSVKISLPYNIYAIIVPRYLFFRKFAFRCITYRADP